MAEVKYELRGRPRAGESAEDAKARRIAEQKKEAAKAARASK